MITSTFFWVGLGIGIVVGCLGTLVGMCCCLINRKPGP